MLGFVFSMSLHSGAAAAADDAVTEGDCAGDEVSRGVGDVVGEFGAGAGTVGSSSGRLQLVSDARSAMANSGFSVVMHTERATPEGVPHALVMTPSNGSSKRRAVFRMGALAALEKMSCDRSGTAIAQGVSPKFNATMRSLSGVLRSKTSD